MGLSLGEVRQLSSLVAWTDEQLLHRHPRAFVVTFPGQQDYEKAQKLFRREFSLESIFYRNSMSSNMDAGSTSGLDDFFWLEQEGSNFGANFPGYSLWLVRELAETNIK